MKPWSRRALILLLATGLTGGLAACSRFRHAVGPDQGRLVASRNGETYHLPSCAQAKRIKHRNRLYYRTGDDAYRDGFVPCQVCHPEQAAQPAQ